MLNLDVGVPLASWHDINGSSVGRQGSLLMVVTVSSEVCHVQSLHVINHRSLPWHLPAAAADAAAADAAAMPRAASFYDHVLDMFVLAVATINKLPVINLLLINRLISK